MTTVTNRRLEALAWVLIYGGLLSLCLGLFVQRASAPLGAALLAAGGLATLAGVLLIWLRSRRGP